MKAMSAPDALTFNKASKRVLKISEKDWVSSSFIFSVVAVAVRNGLKFQRRNR
jgi:hypothetical protein